MYLMSFVIICFLSLTYEVILYRIEKQHVQFKVEPNEQNVDALRIAEALSDDISIQKRLTDTLGVDIAKVAAGKRVRLILP